MGPFLNTKVEFFITVDKKPQKVTHVMSVMMTVVLDLAGLLRRDQSAMSHTSTQRQLGNVDIMSTFGKQKRIELSYFSGQVM